MKWYTYLHTTYAKACRGRKKDNEWFVAHTVGAHLPPIPQQVPGYQYPSDWEFGTVFFLPGWGGFHFAISLGEIIHGGITRPPSYRHSV